MNKTLSKIISLFLCLIMLIGSSIVLSANSTLENTQSTVQNSNAASITDNINTIINSGEADKNETVYVIAGTNGNVKKIIVSNWIKNTDRLNKITDKSDLNDIKNLKDDFSYSIDKNNMKIWDAEGKDIYYSGTTDKQLPVEVSINYKLNGKEITAEELAGKSGKVTISFSYKNNQKQTVSIDENPVEIYVPFVMISGMVMDNENFTNITISNGKLINDGDRSIVIGFAFPGLQDNLALSKDKLDIPETVEITADVRNFKLATTLTFATNDVLSKINIENLSTVDDLINAVGQMSDASKQLVDGSDRLYDGITVLLDKSDELIEGITTLADGIGKLAAGTQKLYNGSTDLKLGINELKDGLSDLNGYSETLTDGAKQVFESLLTTADSQLKASGLTVPKLTIDNYRTTLNSVIASLDKDKVYKLAYDTALTEVAKQVDANESLIRAEIEKEVKAVVQQKVIENAGMTPEQYEQGITVGIISELTQQQINGAVDAQMSSDEVKSKINTLTKQQKDNLIDSAMKSSDVTDRINIAVTQAQAGQEKIQALILQLDSYNEFYCGIIQYTDGVSIAYNGSEQIYNGASELNDGLKTANAGIKKLVDGFSELQNGSDELIDGVDQLKGGAMQLSDGMKKFDEEAMQKLVDITDSDIKSLIVRFRATVDISRAYKSYSGISNDMSGSVKFIYKTDSIGE